MREGMQKKGGVNEAPTTPKPNIKPPAQTPVQPSDEKIEANKKGKTMENASAVAQPEKIDLAGKDLKPALEEVLQKGGFENAPEISKKEVRAYFGARVGDIVIYRVLDQSEQAGIVVRTWIDGKVDIKCFDMMRNNETRKVDSVAHCSDASKVNTYRFADELSREERQKVAELMSAEKAKEG